MPKARIEEIKYDGYERLYLLELIESNNKVWAYGLERDNYIQCGCEFVKEIVEKECDFSIEWVTKIIEANFDVDEIIQDKLGSSHVVCKVTISKVIGSDSFEFVSDNLGTIIVELEDDVDFLKIDRKVLFAGNLRVDFI